MSEFFDIKIKGTEKFYKDLEVFRRKLNLTTRDTTNLFAQRIAISMMNSTYPKKAVKKTLEGAVRMDIKKVYIDVGEAYYIIAKKHGKMLASAFVSRVNKGMIHQAKAYIKGTDIVDIGFDGGRLYRSQRVDGKIPKKCKKIVVLNNSQVEHLIKKQQMEVGKMRAGFFHISKNLGVTKGVGAWIKKHPRKLSKVTRRGTGNSYQVTTENRVKYVDEYLSPKDQASAISRTQKGIIRKMEKDVDNLAKKV